MTKDNIYQLKVTLRYSKPPIWRRIEVPGNTRLDKLHRILQDTMGWDDEHMHQFVVGRTYYGEQSQNGAVWQTGMLDEKDYRLDQIAPREKSIFVYEYDFGDGWEHSLLVEKILPRETGVFYPRCIKGKRACPPEDVGGLWGYFSFLEIIGNPEHPKHDSMLEWIGGEFDPEAFDLDAINESLKRLR